MVEVGDKAPNFNLPNQDKKTISLSDFSGEWLILYFYPKDDTPGCTKEACDMTEGLPDFSNLNASVLGISRDDAESHAEFIAKYDIGFDLLSDSDITVHKAFSAWGMKKNYGKEYEGTFRSTFIISPEGNIVAKWKNVRVRSKRKSGEVKHSDIVLEKLKDLQA